MKYALFALIALALALSACQADPSTTQNPDDMPGMNDTHDMGDMNGTESENAAQDLPGEPDVTFVLEGENFHFLMDGEENPTLTVQQGDLVRIEFSSRQGFHDWVLDAFDAATAQVWDYENGTVVEFIADEAGTFEYYCSVGQHREMGMVGTFIVE